MPDREPCDQRAADDAPDAGRAQHVGIAAQARGLLAAAATGAQGPAQRWASGARRQKPRWFVPSRNDVPLAASGEG